MADTSPEALWEHWREHVATRLDWRPEECEAGGGSDLYDDGQKSATAQTWRNAARKVRVMAMPPLPHE